MLVSGLARHRKSSNITYWFKQSRKRRGRIKFLCYNILRWLCSMRSRRALQLSKAIDRHVIWNSTSRLRCDRGQVEDGNLENQVRAERFFSSQDESLVRATQPDLHSAGLYESYSISRGSLKVANSWLGPSIRFPEKTRRDLGTEGKRGAR